MPNRRFFLGVVAIVLIAPTAHAAGTIRTQNFVVHAPDQATAQQFGQMAEHYRKQKAVEWLGQEIPNWPQPCPLYVKVTMSGAGGATKFDYRGGSYTVLSMEIEGPIERMLHSVLPHEITHTVFAHFFRFPVPRWADEGGSVLSEDEQEKMRHDQLCRQFLNTGGKEPLRRLFNLKEYHEAKNVMVIYAEGFSVSNYLVGLSDRPTFLNFVSTGMRQGWDRACQQHYGVQTVEQMEEAWLQHLRTNRDVVRNPRGDRAVLVAGNVGRGPATSMSREVVRLTAPPAQPQLDPAGPIYRGQAGDNSQKFGSPAGVIPLGSTPRPATTPTAKPVAPRSPPPPVALGLPEFAPNPQAAPIRPAGPSPVGFQN